ncbi:MAG: hypothetical protein K0S01_2269 [Herbinix sp.]|jgi:cbb3-type cytochrome oxidase subunit 3|nr:hypothetical protein [Herbinix sp.]
MNQNFIYSLEIMGKGMLSIFIVILILTFIVMLLAKFSAGKKKQDSEE